MFCICTWSGNRNTYSIGRDRRRGVKDGKLAENQFSSRFWADITVVQILDVFPIEFGILDGNES